MLALGLSAPAAAALALPVAHVDVELAGAKARAQAPAQMPGIELPRAEEIPLAAASLAAPAPAALPLALPSLALVTGAPFDALPFATAPVTLVPDRDAPPAPPPEVQAAAAGGAAILLAERAGLGRLAAMALAALYSRLRPSQLLDHERRDRVVQLVRERPGIGPSEIAAALGTGWGVTTYHLDRLERAGLVTSQRVGQHRCYFLPGAVPRDAQGSVGLFRVDTTRRVAQLVRERPGIAQRDLAATLGLSASATSKQVSRLEAAALVRRESDGDGLRLYPEPSLSGALAPASA